MRNGELGATPVAPERILRELAARFRRFARRRSEMSEFPATPGRDFEVSRGSSNAVFFQSKCSARDFGVSRHPCVGLFGSILGLCWVYFGSDLMARMPMAMVAMMTATME